MERVQHRQPARELEGGSVEGVLADHVDWLSGDRLEHRAECGRDAGSGRRRSTGRHDQGSLGVERHRHHMQLYPGELGPFGAVQRDVMAAGGETRGQVADERLRAAELRRAQRRHRRGDDGDSHNRGLV